MPMRLKKRPLGIAEYIARYEAQREPDTFIDALVNDAGNIVTPSEQMAVIWLALDEDLEGWPLVNTAGEIVEASAAQIQT
ncbi:unnamed protein product, partial [marine sediment metagenome]